MFRQTGWLFPAAVFIFLLAQVPALGWGDCPCDPDVDGSGVVDGTDQTVLDGCVGSPPEGACKGADIDCDGDIDADDQAAWACLDGGGDAGLCCSFVLDLEQFRYVEANPSNVGPMTGAAVLQMTLDWLHWNSSEDPSPPQTFADQQWLFDYAHSRNDDPNTDFIDAGGLLATLQEFMPLPYSQYGYNFVIVSHG